MRSDGFMLTIQPGGLVRYVSSIFYMGALKGQLRFTSTRSIRGLKHLWALAVTPCNFPERYPNFIKVSKAAKLCWIWMHCWPFKRFGNIWTYINVVPERNERHLFATLRGISEELWLLSLFHIKKKINLVARLWLDIKAKRFSSDESPKIWSTWIMF